MAPLNVLVVFGTRPEAIKMAPVVLSLQAQPQAFRPVVCVTAQHRQMLDQVLQVFGIQPQIDLNLMQPNQDLFGLTTRVLSEMRRVLDDVRPDIVLVHGDTTTTMATSLAAFYQQVPIGHVEAGLRTYNAFYPFPEEMNRVLTDTVATLGFAPTARSRENLLRLGMPEERIHVTGNTVIDALQYTLTHTRPDTLPETVRRALQSSRVLLVTTHRRENFGEPLRRVCEAILTLVARFADLSVVLPVHPNPNVTQTVHHHLGSHPRIHLIEPLDYAPFCHLMAGASLILTDSGGVQEEAPSLGKPVLVLRDETERPEAVEMGTVRLVGTDTPRIVETATELLSDPATYSAMANQVNPYGDGQAAPRILQALSAWAASRALPPPSNP